MTEYRFHWRPSGATPAVTPTAKIEAESHLHGAALALRKFIELGCDLAAPLAHLDITEPTGVTQTLLVEEVLDWLHQPQRAEFIHREGLSVLLPKPG